MDDVTANIDTEVTTDGARGGGQGVGGTDEETRGSNDALTLPNLDVQRKELNELQGLGRCGERVNTYHNGDGARGQEVNKTLIEALALVLGVVLLNGGARGSDELETNELEALLLPASNDLTNLSNTERENSE